MADLKALLSLRAKLLMSTGMKGTLIFYIPPACRTMQAYRRYTEILGGQM